MATTRRKTTAIEKKLASARALARELERIVGSPDSMAGEIAVKIDETLADLRRLITSASAVSGALDNVLGVEGYAYTSTTQDDCECLSDRRVRGLCPHVKARRAMEQLKKALTGKVAK